MKNSKAITEMTCQGKLVANWERDGKLEFSVIAREYLTIININTNLIHTQQTTKIQRLTHDWAQRQRDRQTWNLLKKTTGWNQAKKQKYHQNILRVFFSSAKSKRDPHVKYFKNNNNPKTSPKWLPCGWLETLDQILRMTTRDVHASSRSPAFPA